MRAVLDTNVVVSALFSPRGSPAAILQAWREGALEWCTSPDLLDELARVLDPPVSLQRLGWSADEAEAFIDGVRARVVMVTTPEARLRVVAADPDDDRVLEAAVAGRADCIVSGDRHLLELEEYEGIQILSPGRFAALLSLE